MATLPSVPSSSSSSHHNLQQQRHATAPPSSPSRTTHDDAPTQRSQKQQDHLQPTMPTQRQRSRHNTISSTLSSTSSTHSKNPLKFVRLLHLQPSTTLSSNNSSNSNDGSSSSSHSKRLNEPASPRALHKQPQQPHRHHHHHSHHLHAAAAKFREKVQQRGGFLSFLQSHYHALHPTSNSHHRDHPSSKSGLQTDKATASSVPREPPSTTSSLLRGTLNGDEQTDSGYHQQQKGSNEPGGALLQSNGRSTNQSLGKDFSYRQQLSTGEHPTASFLSTSSAHYLQHTSSPIDRDNVMTNSSNNTEPERKPDSGQTGDHADAPRPSLSSTRSWVRRPSSCTMLSSPSSTLSPPISSPVSPISPVNSYMTIQSVKQFPPLSQSISSSNPSTKHTVSSQPQPHPSYNLTISDFRVAQHLQRNLITNTHEPKGSSDPQQQRRKPHSNARLHEKSSLPSLTLKTKVSGRFSERRNAMGNCVSECIGGSHIDSSSLSSPLPTPSSPHPHTSYPSSPLHSPRSPTSASASPTTLSSHPSSLEHARYKASLYELAQSKLDAVSPRSHLQQHQHKQQTVMHREEATGQYSLSDVKGDTQTDGAQTDNKDVKDGLRDHDAGDCVSTTNGKHHGADQSSESFRKQTTATSKISATVPLHHHSQEGSTSILPSPSSVTAAFKNLRKKPSLFLSFLKRKSSPSNSAQAEPAPEHYLSLPVGGTITLSPSMPTTPNGGVYNMCSEDLSSSEFARLAGITILPDVDVDDEVDYYNYEDSMQGQKTSVSWQMPSSSSSRHPQSPTAGVSGLGLGAAGSASTSIHRTLFSRAMPPAGGNPSSSGLSSATTTAGILDRERNATNYSLVSDTSRRKVNIWDPLFWTMPCKDNAMATTNTAAVPQENSKDVTSEGTEGSHQQQRLTSSNSTTGAVEPPSPTTNSYFPPVSNVSSTATSLPMRVMTRERSATTTQLSSSAPQSRSPSQLGLLPRSRSSSPPSTSESKQGQYQLVHNGMLSPRRHSSAVSPTARCLSPSSPPTPTLHSRQLASSSVNHSPSSASVPPSPVSAMAPAAPEGMQQIQRRPSSTRLAPVGGTCNSNVTPTPSASAVLLPHNGPVRRKSFSSLTALAIELDHETNDGEQSSTAEAEVAVTPATPVDEAKSDAAAVEIKLVNPTPPALSDSYYEKKVHPLSPTMAEFPGGVMDEVQHESNNMVRQQSSSGKPESGGGRVSRFQPVYSSTSSSSVRSSSRSRSRSRSRSPTPSAHMTGKRSSPLSKEYDPSINSNISNDSSATNSSSGSGYSGAHHHHHHHHDHHSHRPSFSRSHTGHSRFELCTADGTSITDLKAFSGMRVGGDRLSPLSASFDHRAIAANDHQHHHHHHHHHHHRSSLQHTHNSQKSPNSNGGPRRFSHQNHLSPVSAYTSNVGISNSSSSSSVNGAASIPTTTKTLGTKVPTTRYPSSHQRTLSLPSNTPPPLPVPTSTQNGNHRGSEFSSSSYQERSLLSSSPSRRLHPFDQPIPPAPQSPTRTTLAPYGPGGTLSKPSVEPRHFTPGTKVGRFTLVDDKNTTGLDLETAKLRRGSQLSMLSNASATMEPSSSSAALSSQVNSGCESGPQHEQMTRVVDDHHDHPMRRPSSSLSATSSTCLDTLEPSTTSESTNKGNQDAEDREEEDDNDDDEKEEHHARVIVDPEDNCVVFQRKRRGHPNRRVPATCSFTATAAATSAESPYSLQPQPQLSSMPQQQRHRHDEQLSSSLPSSFYLPPAATLATFNGSRRGGSEGGSNDGGNGSGVRTDGFEPLLHP